MKTFLITLSLVLAAQTFANDTLGSKASCKLNQETLERIPTKEMEWQTGIWFLNLPVIFDLEISNTEVLMKYNSRNSIGIKGQDYESAWNYEKFIKFGNYTESDREWYGLTFYGWIKKSSVKINNNKIKGQYKYKSRSPITSSGDAVLHTYQINYDRLTMKGTLHATTNIREDLTKYDLNFTCN